MAKAKNLAALAGLAGLAYAMSNKGKDKEKGTTDSNPTRAARFESTETRLKSPAESIAAADKSDKSTSISTKGESGTTTPGPDKSTPNLDVKPTPVKPRNVVSGSDLPPAPKTPAADNTTAAAIPSGIMGGARQRTNTVSSSAEGMKNYKPRRPPVVSSTEEGMKNYKPRRSVPPLRPAGMNKGGMTASSRADGIASKGKTRGRIC